MNLSINKKIKEDYKRKLVKDIKIFLKKKKKKNMVENVTKIKRYKTQKMKNNSLLSIEKNILE